MCDRIAIKDHPNLKLSMKNSVFWEVTPCGSFKNRPDVSEELSASFIRVTKSVN
jgi:hypothetical protein